MAGNISTVIFPITVSPRLQSISYCGLPLKDDCAKADMLAARASTIRNMDVMVFIIISR
jgi:hypothetical protein